MRCGSPPRSNIGTILFNVSTSAALSAHTMQAEERLVWNPDGRFVRQQASIFVLLP